MPTMQAILRGPDALAAGPAGLTDLLRKHDIKSLGDDGETPTFEGLLAENALENTPSGHVEAEYAGKVDVSEIEAPALDEDVSAEADTDREMSQEDESDEIAVEDLFAGDIVVPMTDDDMTAAESVNETAGDAVQTMPAEEAPAPVESAVIPVPAAVVELPAADAGAADLSSANPKGVPEAPAETAETLSFEKAGATAEPAGKDVSADEQPGEDKPQRGAEVKLPEAAAHDEPVRERNGLETNAATEDASAAPNKAEPTAFENQSWNASAASQAAPREAAASENAAARPRQGGENFGARIALDAVAGLNRMESSEAAGERPVAEAQRMTAMNETLFVDTMLRQARLIARPNGDADMTMSLEPEELGSVTIRLSLRHDRLTAEVGVENESARSAMTNVIQRVRQALAEDGLELDEFNIGLRRDWRQHANQQSQNGQPERDRNAAGAGETEMDSGDPKRRVRAAGQLSGTGTMDFLA